MRTFKDNAGRTWTVAVNVATVRQVRALLNVDLLDIAGGKLIDRLVSDPILLVDVIYAVCKTEADRLGVSDEDFGRAMGGDVIEAATSALLEETIDFFPNRRDRERAKRVLASLNKWMEKVQDTLDLKASDEKIQEKLQAALNKLSP